MLIFSVNLDHTLLLLLLLFYKIYLFNIRVYFNDLNYENLYFKNFRFCLNPLMQSRIS